MKKVDVETILLCAVMAVAGAVGIVAGLAAFTGINFQECNALLLFSGSSVLGGIIWWILLNFNSKRGIKGA